MWRTMTAHGFGVTADWRPRPVDAVGRLWRDHERLQRKLHVVSSTLPMGREALPTLRSVCFTLVRQLEDHVKREAAFPRTAQETCSPPVPSHQHQVNRLWLVVRHLHLDATVIGLDEVTDALTAITEALREEIADQETFYFPVLARVVGRNGEGRTPADSLPIDETHTVRQILERYPAARTVFERFCIDPLVEGHDPLDEVSWRHGVDSLRMLEYLEQAVYALCNNGV